MYIRAAVIVAELLNSYEQIPFHARQSRRVGIKHSFFALVRRIG